MRHVRAILTLLAAVLLGAPAAAHAAGLIDPERLAAHVRDLPGFTGASRTVEQTTSPFTWAHSTSFGTWTEAQLEATTLQGLGFQEGVAAYFTGRSREAHSRHREALSQGIVFATAAGAQSELTISIAATLKNYAKSSPFQHRVTPIPGAVSIGGVTRGRLGGSDTVLFATGRCFFVVGNAVPSARAPAALERAPIAGALALYRRDKRLCA